MNVRQTSLASGSSNVRARLDAAEPLPFELDATRVVKKIKPSQPGAVKLSRQYGDALVCVRYRHDASGERRYTTVEVVIECVPVQARATRAATVEVKLEYDNQSLRSVVQASGGQWDPQAKVWRMPERVAKRLGLLSRVLAK